MLKSSSIVGLKFTLSHFGRVAQVARATALQAVGHRFKSCPAYLLGIFYGLVAQLV